ncbi:MAG: 3-keto-disaccharide hydrolase, partial [Planctomycetota bacterium]
MRRMVFAILSMSALSVGAENDFSAWYNSDKWDVAGDAALNSDNIRRLVGRAGSGILINGKEGKCPSLVTKRRDYRDVEIHVEFMVAKGSNSGVIFHGNHEIQILDSHGIQKPTAGHCGGVYPRAESKPTYHHIDKGSAPRVNAAKPAGQWQTLDIIFQAARFDKAGKKTAHARFVEVVHNGEVIQEDVEVPYACGPNWDRKQYPQGPIIIQGDYGPIAVRNLRIKEWKADEKKKLNVPPDGFTALFNGKDFTGWRVHPKVREMWKIEDGVFKSHGLLREWGADLTTKKEYRDFILMLDFRMPTISDSGIN